jgi:hypothetical protein
LGTISVIDVILIWQVLLSLPVLLDDRIENLNPLLKANNMIAGDVSWAGALVEFNLAALFEGGKFRKAACSLCGGPRVNHVGTKINISG